MRRTVLRLVLDVVLTIAVALGLLTLGQWLLSGFTGEPLAEAVRVLFNFMDVGLAVWIVLLIVALVRRSRRARPPVSAGRTWVLLLVGAAVNLVVVTVVGFVQGGWAPLLVLFAIEAGIACLVAAAVVIPIVHRVVAGEPPATPTIDV